MYIYIYIYRYVCVCVYIYIYIYRLNKSDKYCCWIKTLFNVIKVLVVYNRNNSFCFPPGWYQKSLMFDLILKRDLETYQKEVLTKKLECIVETY